MSIAMMESMSCVKMESTSNVMIESLHIDTIPEDKVKETTTSQYWQVDKNLGYCLIELYNRHLWTDVCIRCSDHNIDDTADRIYAHKVILAARSPVFQGIFFGPLAESRNEISLENIDKETFECFVRYVYSDKVELTQDLAISVLKTAHEYQVTGLVTFCSDFLKSVLNKYNACRLLDLALLYDLHILRDASCEFIDCNVDSIMQTEGFLQMTQNGICYILKGDTLYDNETNILKRTENWAKHRCTEKGLTQSGENIRQILGPAFFFLRFPTMTVSDFSECTRRKGYFILDEYEDIIDHITSGKVQSVLTNSTVKRIPRTEILSLTKNDGTSDFEEEDNHFNIDLSVHFNVKRKIFLTAFTLAKINPYFKFSKSLYSGNSRNLQQVPGTDLPRCLELCLKGSVQIIELSETRHFSVMLSGVSKRLITLDPPICIPNSKSSYTMIIEMTYAPQTDEIMMSVCSRVPQSPVKSRHVKLSFDDCIVMPIESFEILNTSSREKDTEDSMEYAEKDIEKISGSLCSSSDDQE